MKWRVTLLTVCVAAPVLFLVLRSPVVVHSQTLPPAPEGQQFRIAVGLKDTEAKVWTGKVEVAGGEILALTGWRSGPADKAASNGDFAFTTKIALLENQLRAGSEYGQTGYDGQAYRRQIPQGLMLKIRGANAARISLRSQAGSFSFGSEEIAYGERLYFLDGNASVERLPVERKFSVDDGADDYPAIAASSDGKRWVAWISYKDKADVVKVSDGATVYSVGEPGDLHAPAVGSAGDGVIYTVWPRNESGGFQLYGAVLRNGSWSKQEKLTNAGSSNFWPQIASDGKGTMALVWQSFRGGQSVIMARRWSAGRWGTEQKISEGPGNCWSPAVAFGGGKLWVAWDSYATGAYQIYAREWGRAVVRVTKGDRFSVRPSLAVTANGSPVIAWEESDQLWGKDFAYQVDKRGTVEYKNRRIQVAYLTSGEWKQMASAVESAVAPEIRRFVQQPQLALDGAGHLYLAFRIRTTTRNSRIDYFAGNGRWEAFLTHLDGTAWTKAIPLPASVGRNSMRAALAIDGGQVYAVWATDARSWMNGTYDKLDIFASTLRVAGNAARFEGGASMVASNPVANPNPSEAADLARIRSYKYLVDGKPYRIIRGDFHRHTELSGDGAGDGMLEDNYRYTLDAANMDIGYVSDHQMGQGDEYNWWLTQKSNDLYYMPQRFVPMYGYERSVPYPNGHRNVIWAERGKPVLKISPAETQGKENTGPNLYPYLRETGGIVTSHTSATGQGTDWRDNDPALEPVVEIYQGYDANYEEPGAPRAWKPGQSQSHERNEPAGYVWNAWAKGYKLGVQSSSDHISTHTSYACVITNDFTRRGILEAIRKRHTYAATDNIVMDFRIANTAGGEAIMGDIAKASAQPRLNVHIIGTAAIKQIDVIKNNKYVHQLTPNRSDVKFEYLDASSSAGESYYYVRVEQVDGQLAWSSPIWIQRQ